MKNNRTKVNNPSWSGFIVHMLVSMSIMSLLSFGLLVRFQPAFYDSIIGWLIFVLIASVVSCISYLLRSSWRDKHE